MQNNIMLEMNEDTRTNIIKSNFFKMPLKLPKLDIPNNSNTSL